MQNPVKLGVTGYFYITLDTNLSQQCSGLRRHSFSAPARLSLERLEVATFNLGLRVSSLSSLVRSGSIQPEFRNNLDTMRTCHGCHAPIDDDHKGYMTGASQYPLEHWDGCKGDIGEGVADWRPCPVVSEEDETVTEGSASEND